MSEANVVSEPIAVVRRCARCHGKMMVDRTSGDSACFTCGNVVYLVPPIENLEVVRREPRRTYPSRPALS